VLHASKIPTFDGCLSCEDSEALLSYLAVPALRASMVLKFFADENRLVSLANAKLRKILWSSMFCPGVWPMPSSIDAATGEASPPACITDVPCMNASRLCARQGYLLVELRSSPTMVLGSMQKLVKNTVDVAAVGDFTTPYSNMLFFTVRLCEALLRYARHAMVNLSSSRSWELDGFVSEPDEHTRANLAAGVEELSTTLSQLVMPLIKKWVGQAVAAATGADTVIMTSQTKGERAAQTQAAILRQKEGHRISITANAHIFLLASPSLCAAPKHTAYSNDALGHTLVCASLAAMAYLIQWYGKGAGSKLYGT
jgi:hypothetical protein